MPHVDTSKILSRPTRTGRLLYLSQPFLEGFGVRRAGKFTQEALDEHYEKAQEKATESHVTGALKSYRTGHEVIIKHLPRLRSRVVVLSPGISIDNSTNKGVGYCGNDWVSERFRLSEEHLWMLNRIDQRWKKETGDYCYELEHLVFVYDSPFKIAPAIVKRVDAPVKAKRVVNGLEETIESERPLILAQPFPEIFDAVNEILMPTQAKIISNIRFTKELGQQIAGQKGLYKFSDLLFDSSGAKRALIDYKKLGKNSVERLEKEIELACALNIQIGAHALHNFLELMRPSHVWAYSHKSSYLMDFIERAGTMVDFVGGFGTGQGILRNAESATAYLRECHPSAIGILENKITQWVRREGMHTKIPRVSEMFGKEWPDCPVLGKMFCCEYAQHCTDGKVGLPCEADVALTMVSPENLQLLMRDAHEYGYMTYGIESVFAYLNSTDREEVDLHLYGGGHFSKSLKKITDEVTLVPVSLPRKPLQGKYHLRWSEHGSGLSCIISKFTEGGRARIVRENGLKLDLTLATAGSTRHMMDLQQHCGRILQNNTLKAIGLPQPMPRNSYTEGEVYYALGDIIVKGHFDSPFQTVLKSGHAPSEFANTIGAIDLKRAQYTPYEREYIMRQKLGYALSIQQMHGLDSRFLWGISVKRPFNIDFGTNPGAYRLPRHNINVVDSNPENKLIAKVHEDLLESYQLQARLLHDRQFLLEYDCGEVCYSHVVCEFLKRGVRESGKGLLEVLDGLRVMPQDWQAPEANKY